MIEGEIGLDFYLKNSGQNTIEVRYQDKLWGKSADLYRSNALWKGKLFEKKCQNNYGKRKNVSFKFLKLLFYLDDKNF